MPVAPKARKANSAVSAWLAEIGRRGGRKSRRILEPGDARAMVKVREARRAFKQFYSQCFWSFDPQTRISTSDLEWVARQLRTHGGREAWFVAEKLCR